MNIKPFFFIMLISTLFFISCETESDSQSFDREYWGGWVDKDGSNYYISDSKFFWIWRARDEENWQEYKEVSINRLSSSIIEYKRGDYNTGWRCLYASRRPDGIFSGTVINGSGSPLAGKTVTASPVKNSALKAKAITDSEGRFTVSGIIPGDEYNMEVSGKRYIVKNFVSGDDIGVLNIDEGGTKAYLGQPSYHYVGEDPMLLFMGRAYIFVAAVLNDSNITWSLDLESGFVYDYTDGYRYAETYSGNIQVVMVKCNPTDKEYELKKVRFSLKDTRNNKSWEDYVTLKFYNTPVTYKILANTSKINGMVYAPDARGFYFKTVFGSASIEVPWSSKDFLVLLNNEGSESRYAIGINDDPDLDFTGVEDTTGWEPKDSEEYAMEINFTSPIKAFIHDNTNHYYKINLREIRPDIESVN